MERLRAISARKIGECRSRSACSAENSRLIPNGGHSAANAVSFKTSRDGRAATIASRTRTRTTSRNPKISKRTVSSGCPMTDTLTIPDNRTGKKYELPIQDGTIRAMDLRQIKTGAEDF